MSARKLRPTGRFVLVKPLLPPARFGSIHIPEQWQQPSGHALVMAVGGAVKEVKQGDRIVYAWINGRDVEHDGQTRRLLDEREILGIVSDENDT